MAIRVLYEIRVSVNLLQCAVVKTASKMFQDRVLGQDTSFKPFPDDMTYHVKKKFKLILNFEISRAISIKNDLKVSNLACCKGIETSYQLKLVRQDFLFSE